MFLLRLRPFAVHISRPTLALLTLCLTPLCAATHAQGTSDRAPTSYKFVNGLWFDGEGFRAQTLYSVQGVFAKEAPAQIDKVVDLAGGYVVPPFGDAHNHYIAGPHDIRKILNEYLRDGIFYAKNPASIHRDSELIKDLINKPSSVDVTFANAGITATGGHPVKLYEIYLAKTKKPGPDNTFNNLGYYIIDNRADLEAKWPFIIRDHPDLIKVHLLYSEEFQLRKSDAAYYGDRGLDPEVLTLIVAKAHQSGLPVACHIETAQDFRNALTAGVDEIAHMPGYFPDLAHPEWFPITATDAALAKSKGVDVVTTTYVSTAEIKDPAELKRVQEIQVHNLRLLHQAGVKLAIGPDVYGVTALAEAMNLYHLKVFDNLTLLKMWSENSPEVIFPRRKIGRLRDGYEASFLVLEGDPIADFENVKRIRLRFKQGFFISEDLSRPEPKNERGSDLN